MSINMTQALKFETDDLRSFEQMLAVAVRVLFKPNGRYVRQHIRVGDQPPCLFPDGRDYREEWLSQPEVLKDGDGKFYLLETQGVFGGAPMRRKINVPYDDQNAAARASCSQRKEAKPTRMWICTLSDYEGDFRSAKKNERIFCRGYDDMVKKTMNVVRAADPRAFVDQFGDGYHYGFNSDDGSVGHGYLMQWRPNGGWNVLYISMVHAYYGK